MASALYATGSAAVMPGLYTGPVLTWRAGTDGVRGRKVVAVLFVFFREARAVHAVDLTLLIDA